MARNAFRDCAFARHGQSRHSGAQQTDFRAHGDQRRKPRRRGAFSRRQPRCRGSDEKAHARTYSQGAVARLSGCTLVNRTRKSLKDAGARYVLYKGSTLEFPEISRDEDAEREFIVTSGRNFPDVDGSASFDPSFAKVRYKKTDEDFEREMKIEKAVIKARLESEMRDNPGLRDID